MARLIDRVQGHAATWDVLLSQIEHLPHALAFTGPSGTGKRMVAWSLAQALLCEKHQAGACGECGSCRRVELQQSESVLAIEPSGPQIKLEAAGQVQEFLALARLARARIVIVNEAQLLNAQAANALLKVIEEPPPETYILLIVPEISQLLPTLRSRSQVVRFRALSESTLARGEELAAWMVKSARGSFERLASFRDEEMNELRQVTFDFLAQSFQRQRESLKRILEATKERESALLSVRFLQQALRDWAVGEPRLAIHSDMPWTQILPAQVSVHRRVELWRQALQMEADLNAHVDRSLIFENFFYRSQNAMD